MEGIKGRLEFLSSEYSSKFPIIPKGKYAIETNSDVWKHNNFTQLNTIHKLNATQFKSRNRRDPPSQDILSFQLLKARGGSLTRGGGEDEQKKR